MREANELYAYFTIHGDFDPAEITKRIGVSPTKSWKIGDRTKPNSSHVRQFSRWSLETTLPHTEPLEAHIRNVLAQLDAHAAAFEVASRQYDGTMEVVGYFWDSFPGFFLENDIVIGLARYSLAMDFDFYGLYSHRREDTGFTHPGPPRVE